MKNIRLYDTHIIMGKYMLNEFPFLFVDDVIKYEFTDEFVNFIIKYVSRNMNKNYIHSAIIKQFDKNLYLFDISVKKLNNAFRTNENITESYNDMVQNVKNLYELYKNFINDNVYLNDKRIKETGAKIVGGTEFEQRRLGIIKQETGGINPSSIRAERNKKLIKQENARIKRENERIYREDIVMKPPRGLVKNADMAGYQSIDPNKDYGVIKTPKLFEQYRDLVFGRIKTPWIGKRNPIHIKMLVDKLRKLDYVKDYDAVLITITEINECRKRESNV